jgi:hypothetical protein
MNFANKTTFSIAAIPYKWPDGRYFLSVIVKGTFSIKQNEQAAIAAEQIPILYADEFYHDESGSVRFEADIAPFKPKTDIILVGRAYAPGKTSVGYLNVSLRVGRFMKTLNVFGDRHWERSGLLLSWNPSAPQPFNVMDLVYEQAFGGNDPVSNESYAQNPIGTGFISRKSNQSPGDIKLPNIEDPAQLIVSPKDQPKPAGFGCYGRAWRPRTDCLGTYDEKWREERCPDLAADFRFDFYNAAHPDLQTTDYLNGDEEVELVNITPDGKQKFWLPGIKPVAQVTSSSPASQSISPKLNPAEKYPVALNLDTVCFIPDENRLFQIWRGIHPVSDITTPGIGLIEVALG